MEVTSTDTVVTLKDDASETVLDRLHPLVTTVKDRFERSKRARQNDEKRWERAYNHYRGMYPKDQKFTAAEKSRVFVKVTKSKTLAAYGQLTEVLFAGNKFPLSVEATQLPEGIADTVHIDIEKPVNQPGDEEDGLGIGYTGDGNDPLPGETLMDRIGARLASLFNKAKVNEGVSTKPTAINLEPAKLAAKKMEKKIHDQLDESRGEIHLRRAIFEQILLGTGIVKGPLTIDKEYPKWETTSGSYDPVIKPVPAIAFTSCWNFYPDPEATSMMDADYVIERHKMTRWQMRELKKRPFFRESAIEDSIMDGPNYTNEWWEHALDDSAVSEATTRYEVLEYWGMIDGDMVREELGIRIPPSLRDAKEFQVNVWVCGTRLLRMVLNPFVPQRIPYHAFPYELNPYNFFGIGVPENMEDAQTLMNGFSRLAVDNAVLAGNLLIEIDETNLVPGQDLSVYPGKVFRRQGGAPGQAIFGTTWPNTAQANMMMFDKFRQLSDEATGIPSFSHGQTGVTGTGRTAAGMSMLMGAAAMAIKTVVKNVDDYLLRPLGESMFAWNMQFDFDPEIKGDLEVRARGTSSLMQREVKSQRLLQFIQVTANPITAPMVRYDVVLRELADALELDSEKVVADPKTAAFNAALMKASGAGMGAMGPQGMDMTGGGGQNIGVGAAPTPGEPQFTGNQPPMGPPPGGSPQQQGPLV